MHARRTAYLLTAALLTAGCVAVPHGPDPGPPDRAAGRAPSPLPARPEPTEGTPREALATTEPRPEPARTPASRRPTARSDGTGARAPEKTKGTRKTATRKERTQRREGTEKSRTRAAPRPPKKAPPLRPRSRPTAPAAGQPELRRLCRQAREIDAPMGAADLCRQMYGR
ncbi:hypothetical protein ACFQ9J_33760 [Streptomyces sp. NPDC056529]|uniref:hypothetical protein n=1 Tax=Streptomyces sp. NPDC056529 TaxID=3345855 RepID=UPI00367C2B7D